MQNPYLESGKRLLDRLYATYGNYARDWRVYVVGVFLLVIITAAFTISPPRQFPERTIISLRPGAGLAELSETLAREHVVRSGAVFRMIAIAIGGERGMQAGDYYLDTKQNAYTLASRMTNGVRDIDMVKITIPEGFAKGDISNLFNGRFASFDHGVFEALAPEGYLFPDTYMVGVNATASSTIKILNDNFHKRVDPLLPDIEASGHTENEIIVMASLLEAEAKSPEDMMLVAGILWKRMKLGMPLQVDSERGTYTYQGLPDEPINNPGLVSIDAALHPAESKYLYFISDNDGEMHYAKTLDEQTANIKKYL